MAASWHMCCSYQQRLPAFGSRLSGVGKDGSGAALLGMQITASLCSPRLSRCCKVDRWVTCTSIVWRERERIISRLFPSPLPSGLAARWRPLRGLGHSSRQRELLLLQSTGKPVVGGSQCRQRNRCCSR